MTDDNIRTWHNILEHSTLLSITGGRMNPFQTMKSITTISLIASLAACSSGFGGANGLGLNDAFTVQYDQSGVQR